MIIALRVLNEGVKRDFGGVESCGRRGCFSAVTLEFLGHATGNIHNEHDIGTGIFLFADIVFDDCLRAALDFDADPSFTVGLNL